MHMQQCCLPADDGASPVVKLPITMCMMRQESLGRSAFVTYVNGGLPAQPAMSLLLQCSTHRQDSELAYLFCTWRKASSRSSISCATRQRRLWIDRARVAGGRAVLQLLLCCWPSGARGLLLWLLLLLELLVVLLAVLLLLLLVVAVQQ